jgi:hypothetical protein
MKPTAREKTDNLKTRFTDHRDMELGLIITNARFECVVDRDGIKPKIGPTERDHQEKTTRSRWVMHRGRESGSNLGCEILAMRRKHGP